MQALAGSLRSLGFDRELTRESLYNWSDRLAILQYLLERLLHGRSIDELCPERTGRKRSTQRAEAECLAQKLTILGLPSTIAEIEGTGELEDRISFLASLVEVALSMDHPHAENSSSEEEQRHSCQRPDLAQAKAEFAANHAVVSSVCRHYAQLFSHETELLPSCIVQDMERSDNAGNGSCLEDIHRLSDVFLEQMNKLEKEKQQYIDLPKVSPQSFRELLQALSLACESLQAFTSDAHSFNQDYMREFVEHVNVQCPPLYGIGPLATKIIRKYDDIMKVMEKLHDLRCSHEAVFEGEKAVKDRGAQLFECLHKFCVEHSSASLAQLAVLQETTNNTSRLMTETKRH